MTDISINTGYGKPNPGAATTYDDILEGDYKITVYYDDTEADGGRVRVIVAE